MVHVQSFLPNYDVPEEFETHYDYLRKLCVGGIKNRYGDNPYAKGSQ